MSSGSYDALQNAVENVLGFALWDKLSPGCRFVTSVFIVIKSTVDFLFS